MSDLRIITRPLYFPEHTIPNGNLPNHPGAQACWYFFCIAQRAKETVGDSIDDQYVLEGEPWQDKHYVQQKKSIAVIYGLDSPDEMDKFWGYVAEEAKECGLPEPAAEYINASPVIIH